MLRTALRSLLGHKLRLGLSATAIILGVAFVAGTLIFTDTLRKTFTDLFTSTAADVTITKKTAFDPGRFGPGASQAPPAVPAAALATVRAVPGVAAAAGYVSDQGVYVVGKDGKVRSTGGAPGVGVSWDSDPSLSSLHLVSGRAPAGPAQVALDQTTATKTGYVIGDTVRVLTPGPAISATVVAIFRFGDTGGLAGASLAAFDLPTAQRLMLGPGQLSGISARAAPGVTQTTLKARIAAALDPSYAVNTKSEQAKDSVASIASGLAFVNIFLLVFAGVALLVGSFLILNTFSMLVAQRSRELALLRALGASRRQVTTSVLVEAFAVGLFGATAGLAAGYGVAVLLRTVFDAFGLTIDGRLVFAPRTVLWAYAVGVLVTLVAAYLPARRAAKVPPVAALRDEVAMPEGSLTLRAVMGFVLALVGAGLVGAGLASGEAGLGSALVGGGSTGLLVGAILASPLLSRPFIRRAGSPVAAGFGTVGRLARDNAIRNPRRTAATASALMIGLALVTAFSIFGASTNASIDALISKTIGADYIVSTAIGQRFSPDVAATVAHLPGVRSVTQQRFGVAMFAGQQDFFSAVNAGSLSQAIRLDFSSGSTDQLASGGLLVDVTTADARRWRVGSVVPVLFSSGAKADLTVRGVYRVNKAVGPLVMSLQSLTRGAGGKQLDRYVYVNLMDGASPATVKAELTRALAAYPVVSIRDQTEFKDEQKAQVNQLLFLIYALLVLSVVIAVLGIVNTLALSVIERTREIGLLRAVGMSRHQLRRMVVVESVLISAYGAALGLVLGLVFGISLVKVLAGSGIQELSVPVGRLLLFLMLAALVGVLAAILPARRASRLDVLRAVTIE